MYTSPLFDQNVSVVGKVGRAVEIKIKIPQTSWFLLRFGFRSFDTAVLVMQELMSEALLYTEISRMISRR